MPPIHITTVAEFFKAIVLGTTTEGLFLDFKRTIDNWNVPPGVPSSVKQAAQKELCRDISQFANTDGGCLVIGLEEAKNADGIKVASRVVLVDDPDAMRAWIEQAITNYCVPSTFSKSIEILQVPGGPVVVVNVPPSLHTVYVWDRGVGSMEVIGRTNHGKRYLNPDELERHIMNASRATRLAFEATLAKATSQEVILVGGIMSATRRLSKEDDWYPVKAAPIHLQTRDEFSIHLSVPIDGQPSSKQLSVPFDLIRACWVDVAGRLNLFLHVRTIWEIKTNEIRFADQLGP